MSFANLKQNRASTIDKLINAASKDTEKKSYGDDRFWAPTVDKAGNGYAIIRFLPTSEGEDLPWIKYWDHGFKGPTGRWYIENSLTSIGQNDPVSEMNTQLWNSGREEDKDTARLRKRRLHHVSNILVISDSANPQNEGKVFLYKYGKKIMDKVMDVMQPQFQDEKPVNPFDFWGGANFKLKIRNFEGYRNYDKSEFETASPVEGEDSRLEEIWNSQYSLVEFLDPKNFKSYEELQTRLSRVLGNETKPDLRVVTAAPEARSAPAVETDSVPWSTDDDDESLSFFKKLADDD